MKEKNRAALVVLPEHNYHAEIHDDGHNGGAANEYSEKTTSSTLKLTGMDISVGADTGGGDLSLTEVRPVFRS